MVVDKTRGRVAASRRIEEDEIINPFHSILDSVKLENINKCIGDSPLNTPRRGQAKHSAMLNIKITIPHNSNTRLVSWRNWRVMVSFAHV